MKLITPLILCFLLCSCSEEAHYKQIFAMDTVMDLAVYSDVGEELLNEASDIIFSLDSMLDRSDPNSEVSKLNASGSGTVSEDIRALIDYSAEVYYQTDGSFDITVAPLMELWGFYTKEYRVPSDSEIQSVLEKTGFEKISADGSEVNLNGTELDFGGIAKGYAADQVASFLRGSSVESAMLSLGGNVYALGTKHGGDPWRVAIADPSDPSGTVGTVEVSDKAVITSGTYQRNFTSGGSFYHHIIDPKTGKNPENELSSVTVIGDNSAVCDALSTAFFVMGIDRAAEYLREHTEINAIFIDKNGNITITAGLEDIFESENSLDIIA